MEAHQTILGLLGGALLSALISLVPLTPATGHSPGPTEPVMPDGSSGFGGPFTLLNQQGETVTDVDFRGKLLIVYFGYTNCPDLCPIDASNIGTAMDLLGDENSAVQPVFITIDPDRDQPARLGQWLGSVHPSFIGLTGTDEQIATVTAAYKVVFERAKTATGYDDTINHPGLMYVMDIDGHFLFLLPPGTDPETIATEIQTVLPRKQ